MSVKQSANEQTKPTTEPVASKPQQAEKQPKPKPNAPSQQKSSGFLALIFLLVLLTLAGTAALGWLGYQQLIALQQELAARPTQQELQASLQELNALAALPSIKHQQQALKEITENHQFQLIDIQKTLVKSSEPKPRDWQLAEVEYLLRLANQRLKLEEDIDGALTLLKTAEQRLKQANVPGTLGVRSHLLEDIEELESLTKLDKVSLALNLQKLADKALSLKVQNLPEVPSLNLTTVTQPESELNWYQSLWQEIRSLVIVRKRELPIEALPFAEDELALRHQLSALLLQASWAALRGEQELYTSSLAGANKRLVAFDIKQPDVVSFSEQLQTLVDQPIQLVLPETETSLDSLQAFIAQRYKLQLPVMQESLAPEEESKEEQP